jgi:predicted Zn-dependent peptidase
MRTAPTQIAVLALAIALAGCKTTAPTPDPTPKAAHAIVDAPQCSDAARGEVEFPAPPDVPEFADLPMNDGAPAVEELGDHAGVKAVKVGDLLILHKPTPANQVVSTQLYFLDSAARLDPSNQGLERLALNVAVDGGTESTDKDALNAKLASVGASIGSFTDRDYSGVAMKTISPYFDELWPLFEQTVLEPAMPEAEIELARERQLASIQGICEDPDSLVSHITVKRFFDGHPYVSSQLGTAENVSTFTRDHLRGYQRALVSPNRMLLVVVGDVPTASIVEKVSARLARVKSTASAPPATPPVSTPKTLSTVAATKELPTNYIFGLFAAPSPADPDYAAMVIGMDFLADRLFEEVRTKRNLTYAVSAGLSSRAGNYGYFYVTAVDPAATLPVMFDEVERIKTDGVTEQQLQETLNVFITQHYMGQETNSSQASALAGAYITTGDFKRAAGFLDELGKVEPADVQRVFKTYVKGVQFGVVGPNPTALDPTLFDR